VRPRYQAILFDLDGTLVDSSRGIYRAFASASLLVGLVPPSIERFQETIGPPIAGMFDKHFPDQIKYARDRFISEFRQRYDQRYFRDCNWYHGVQGGIRRLKANGFQLGVVTNKPTAPSTRIIENAQLHDHFSLITGIDGGNGSEFFTKTAALSWSLERLGLAATEAIYCGDTLGDWAACQPIGLAFLGVDYGFYDWSRQPTRIEDHRARLTPKVRSIPEAPAKCFDDVVEFFLRDKGMI
jgi:phosphoglycolate phosphatase